MPSSVKMPTFDHKGSPITPKSAYIQALGIHSGRIMPRNDAAYSYTMAANARFFCTRDAVLKAHNGHRMVGVLANAYEWRRCSQNLREF